MIVVTLAVADLGNVDQPIRHTQERQRIFFRIAAIFLAGKLYLNDKIVPGSLTDFAQDHQREFGAALQRYAVFIGALVCERREELSQQLCAVGHVDRYHVKAKALQNPCLLREAFCDFFHVFNGQIIGNIVQHLQHIGRQCALRQLWRRGLCVHSGRGDAKPGHHLNLTIWLLNGKMRTCCEQADTDHSPIKVNGFCQLNQIVLALGVI